MSSNPSDTQLAGTKRVRGGLPHAYGSQEVSEPQTPGQADATVTQMTGSQSLVGESTDNDGPDATPSKSLGTRSFGIGGAGDDDSTERHSANGKELEQKALQKLVDDVKEFTELRRKAQEKLDLAMAEIERLSITGSVIQAQDSAGAEGSQTLKKEMPLTVLEKNSSEPTGTTRVRLQRPRSLSDLGTTNLAEARSRVEAMQTDPQFFPGGTDVNVHYANQPYADQGRTSKVRIAIGTPRVTRPRANSISGDEYQTPETRVERRGRATQAAFTPKVGARVAAPQGGDPPSSDDDSSDDEFRIPYQPQPVQRRGRGDDPPSGSSSPTDDGETRAGPIRTDRGGASVTQVQATAPRPKIDAPKKYDGTDDRPATLRTWTRDVDAYLSTMGINPETFMAVPYIQMCLDGMAKEMYADWRQGMRWPESDANFIVCPYPFSKVVRRFEKEYVSPTAHREAETRWNKIFQERPDGTLKRVTEVIREINQVSKDRAATSEHEMTRKLYDSLHPGLIQNIQLMRGDPDRVTWAKMQKFAKEAEIMYNVQEASKMAAKLPIGQRISNYEAATSGSTMNKMLRKAAKTAENKSENKESHKSRKKDWKQQQTKADSGPKQTSEQTKSEGSSSKTAKKKWSKADSDKRADQFARGACFKCNSTGHLAAACPGGSSMGMMLVDLGSSEEEEDSSAEEENPVLQVMGVMARRVAQLRPEAVADKAQEVDPAEIDDDTTDDKDDLTDWTRLPYCDRQSVVAKYRWDPYLDWKKLRMVRKGHHMEAQTTTDFSVSRQQLLNHRCTKDCLFHVQHLADYRDAVDWKNVKPLRKREFRRLKMDLLDKRDARQARQNAKTALAKMTVRSPKTDDVSQQGRRPHRITLNNRGGFHACIDTGSDLCFVAPYIPRQLGARIEMYEKPKSLKLGTKGSRSMINAYCTLNIEFAGVKKAQRFEIANVFYDVIIGEDFLRPHKCVISYGPDRVVAEKPTVTPEMKSSSGRLRPRKRKGSRRGIGQGLDFDQDTWEDNEDDEVVHLGSMTTGNNALTLKCNDICDREKNAKLPRYRATPAEDAKDYVPTEEDKHRFKLWVLLEFGKQFINEGDKLPFPPLREVLHEIPYLDETDPPRPRRHYKVADAMMPQWVKLKDEHVEAGLWIPTSTRNADPMMPVLKKDGKARPVVDLRACNANTVKLSIPPVDADYIRSRVATNKFHLELDLKGAFQQLRIKPSDIWKTAFTTIHGTYMTPVAQQGDTNSPATLARTMAYVYQGLLGNEMEAYADNLFVLGMTWKELRDNTIKVLVRSRIHYMYFSASSLKVCPEWVEVLGMDCRFGCVKMSQSHKDAIMTMAKPSTKKQLQRFLGSVEWLSRFIPHLAEMAAPLTNLVGENPWTWSAAQDLAFEETQRAIDQARQLTVIRQGELAPRESDPIHFGQPPTTVVTNPVPGKYIFLQCDASTVGTSACVMYGENWWTAQPVYHHSRKLTGAQLNYPVHEIELLAIYEGFQKYRNILFGRKVIVLTDNSSLTSFLTAKEMNDRQARAYAFMSRFDFSIRHIDGECNHVPDMLSRQYEGDHLAEGYVEDGRLDDLDTERDDGPLLFDRSLGAMKASTSAKGKTKAPERPATKAKTTRRPSGKRAAKAKAARLEEEGGVPSEHALNLDADHHRRFMQALTSYGDDTFFQKIVSQIEVFDRYELIDDVLWQKDEVYGDRMCVASGTVDGRTAREIVLEHVHEMTGHVASRRMTDHAQHHFWWPSLSSDIDKYCRSCESCQVSKKGTQGPSGKIHSMPVPSGPGQTIAVDFQGPLVAAKWQGKSVDFLCNWIDTFTGEVISIPCEQTISAKDCAELFFHFVFPQWGVPKQIVSDRDPRWTSAVWRAIFEGLGTTLLLSTSFHPQTNGRIERMHRDLNAIMRQVINEDQSNWPDQVPFVVHALNSTKSATTGFSPYELARVVPPTNVPGWAKAPAGTPAAELLQNAVTRTQCARDNILKARGSQAFFANQKRKPENNGDSRSPIGSLYLVKTENFASAAQRARKWTAPWAGPFECTGYTPNTSSYTLQLGARYASRNIHPTFHASQVKRWVANDADRFPNRLFNPKPLFPIDGVTLMNADPELSRGQMSLPDNTDLIDYEEDADMEDAVRLRRRTPLPAMTEAELLGIDEAEGPVAAPATSRASDIEQRTPTETVSDAKTAGATAGDNRDTFATIPAGMATAHVASEEAENNDGAGTTPPPPPPRRAAPKPYDRAREIARIHAAFADRGPLTFKVAFKGQSKKDKPEYVLSTAPEMQGLWTGFCNDERNELSRFMATQGNANSERALLDYLRETHEQQQADPNFLTRHERKARDRALEQRTEDGRKANALLQLEVEGQHLRQQWLEGNAHLGQYSDPLGNLGVYRRRR